MRSKTIAYFSRIVHDSVGSSILQGILQKASELDINILTFRGGKPGVDTGSAIYQLISDKIIDGIISWAYSYDDSGLKFFNDYSNLPLVTLTIQLPGIPSIFVDCYAGMKTLIDHLILKHNKKKIAFIRGPEAHVYAKERYNAYVDTIKKHGLVNNEQLITPPGGWSREWGLESIKLLIEQRNLKPGVDIDAVVCVNDLIAVSVTEYLNKNGYTIPSDIAVTGYNNSTVALSASPPITTVAMPFKEIGELSVDLIEKKCRGQQVAEKHFLPARVVLAQSCGCQSLSEIRAYRKGLKKLNFQIIKSTGITKKIINKIEKYIHDYHSREKIDVEEIKKQTDVLLDIFFKEIRWGISGTFISKLNDIIKDVINRNGNFDLWNYIISEMRTNISHYLKGTRQNQLANDLWLQAKIDISEAIHRKDQTYIHNYIHRGEVLRLISSKLITTYNQKNLMKALTEALPKLDIQNCFLSIYEKESQTDGKASEWSRLILAFKNNQVANVYDTEARFLSKDLVPASMISEIKSSFYIIEPLHFQEVQIGFVLFKFGPLEGYIYESLSGQLSSALYASWIMEERSYVKELLENTLNSMKNKASTVSYNSKNISDHVSGISTSMEKVAASIKEIGIHINTVMNIINNAVTVTNNAKKDIIDLTDNSKKISEVVDIISDIAEKTSILALNAAIQASRAGEAGKGFNVVAGEVKELSKKTVDSTHEIFEIIKMNRTNSIKSADAINCIVDLINQIFELSTTINVAINQQTDATGEVSKMLIEAAKESNTITDAISEVAKLGADIENEHN